jgi:myo-inositol-1-phosphate synthase
MDLGAFEAALDRNEKEAVQASTIYAYASILEGCPYINFTPSNGALIPAIVQLAEEMRVPVMGNDGKTGETLVKSALAPMFLCRNLEVLSWEGFNILGNMDGRVLDHPKNRQSKINTKDRVLSKILGYSPHTGVHIEYVPSLDDQKTAWDFIHFKGFLGAKMSLQFVWQGYDSILAAPLILDLVRLAEFAKRRGEYGVMYHLASYFKAPMGVDEHRLYEQFQMLVDYAERTQEA